MSLLRPSSSLKIVTLKVMGNGWISDKSEGVKGRKGEKGEKGEIEGAQAGRSNKSEHGTITEIVSDTPSYVVHLEGVLI